MHPGIGNLGKMNLSIIPVANLMWRKLKITVFSCPDRTTVSRRIQDINVRGMRGRMQGKLENQKIQRLLDDQVVQLKLLIVTMTTPVHACLTS